MDNASFRNDDPSAGVTSFSFDGSDVTAYKGQEGSDFGVKDEEKSYVVKFHVEPARKSSRSSAVVPAASSPYVNMTKADVIKFSDTPFWNTFRLASICFFWLIWLAFLATVIAFTIVTPRCQLPVPEWWQKGVFYQVYVRSFFDGDDDGVGDLKGVADKLPILKELGVTALMLSSVFKSQNESSPHAHAHNGTFDYGYEVVDYEDVDASIGGLEGLEHLVNETRRAGLKLLLDFVPNHSGVDHPWFVEFETSSGLDEGWNYYVSAPGNHTKGWKTVYGEDAWSRTDASNSSNSSSKVYLNNFLKTQPDVNLRSSYIAQKFEEYLRHWTKIGIDGFKVVATDKLFEDSDLQNESGNKRDNFERITRWRNVLEENQDEDRDRRIIITDSSDPAYYYGSEGCGCTGAHMSINYRLTNKSTVAEDIYNELSDWFRKVPEGATSFWTTGDQDRPRLSTSVGRNLTRASMLLKFALPGSALIYYGEEIDMEDDDDDENLRLDPVYYVDKTMSRLGQRSLMRWSNESNCGFTNHTWSWLKPNCPQGLDDVQNQRSDGDSTWSFVQKLCRLKSSHPALQYGRMHLSRRNEDVLVLVREYQGSDRLLVAINLGDRESEQGLDLTGTAGHVTVPSKATVALTTRSNGPYRDGVKADLKMVEKLPPGYGFVVTWKYIRTIKG